MAKERNDAEVFGEDFNILEGMEEFLEEVIDVAEATEENKEDQDAGNDVDSVDNNEEVEDGEETTEEDTDQDNAEISSSPLIPYAKYLKEEGILPNLDIDKFDGSIDGLRDGMYSEITNGIEQYKSSLPESIKHLINHYEEGVPLSTILELDNQRLRYDSITEDDLDVEDVQKNLIREYLTETTKFSQEKIEREITRLADLQELENEAKDILPELKLIQKNKEAAAVAEAARQNELAEQARLKEIETLKATIDSTSEIVPGVKVPELLKQKIYKNLTTPVAYLENGQPLNKLGAYRAKNPVQTEIVLNYIYEVTNEFKDWSAFSKTAKRSVISDIENAAKAMDNNNLSGNVKGRGNTDAGNEFMAAIDRFTKS